MHRSSLTAILFAPLLCCAATIKRAANPTVTIASGVVVGTATKVTNQPSATGLANAYLGIPFASSPPLRFAPPEAPKAWSTPLIAQTFSPSCLQQFLPGVLGEREARYFNNPLLAPPPESEDCLYLNVYAPQDASPRKLKPVLFWIFGGDLQIGTASQSYYNGSSLAVNEDVVVVTINYRTNIFGFSSSPEIPVGQQNSGFLDQRFALQWVQQNIKQFGGDPTKVTIFGESAGAYSVKQILANPPSPLPFRAAILESQQELVLGPGLPSYEEVVLKFGCTLALSPLACLRQVSGSDIVSFISENAVNFPAVTGDGTNDAGNTLPSIQSGQFANVPILIGTNANEFTILLAALGVDPKLSVIEDIVNPLGIDLTNLTDAILSTYAGDIVDDGFALLSQVATDLVFTCSTRSLSTAISDAGRQPVWRYRFDAAFPNLQFFPGAGAYHSSEIPEVFGTYPLDNALGNVTDTQIKLSSYMQGVWAGFAKDPSAGPGWPRLGSNAGVELGVLGGKNATTGEYTAPLLLADYPCGLYDPLLVAAGLAY